MTAELNRLRRVLNNTAVEGCGTDTLAMHPALSDAERQEAADLAGRLCGVLRRVQTTLEGVGR